MDKEEKYTYVSPTTSDISSNPVGTPMVAPEALRNLGGVEINKLALFQYGDFTLASGAKSKWKIECDALTEEDWNSLAAMLVERLEPFGFVYGVPTGGQPLADAMKPYGKPTSSSRDLVVDDVWTTGESMSRFIKSRPGGWWNPQRAVIFARNPVPPDVIALFQMSPAKENND